MKMPSWWQVNHVVVIAIEILQFVNVDVTERGREPSNDATVRRDVEIPHEVSNTTR